MKKQENVNIAQMKEQMLLKHIDSLETQLFVKTALIEKFNEKIAFYSSLPVESEVDKGFFQAFEIIRNILGGGK